MTYRCAVIIVMGWLTVAAGCWTLPAAAAVRWAVPVELPVAWRNAAPMAVGDRVYLLTPAGEVALVTAGSEITAVAGGPGEMGLDVEGAWGVAGEGDYGVVVRGEAAWRVTGGRAGGVAGSELRWERLADLPRSVSRPVVGVLAGKVYVLDGKRPRQAYRLPLREKGGWETLWGLGDAPVRGNFVTQGDGQRQRLYFLGRGEVGEGQYHVLNVSAQGWTALPQPPTAIGRPVAVASGQSHVLVWDDAGAWTFNTITRSWAQLEGGALSGSTADGGRAAVRAGTTVAVMAGGGQLMLGRNEAPRSRFRWPDYLALAAYPALLLVLGVVLRVKNDATGDDYFRGGRRIPWWAAGLSLVATQVSAIGFVAVPAKTFATDWSYFLGIASWFVVVPIVTWKFIPVFQRMNVTTAYEFLEARFHYIIRLVTSLLFVAIQLTRAAVVLYLPAIVLSSVTGIDRIWCILAMGLVTTLYTVMGGMQTVIWTDVLQAVMLLGGALVCVGMVLYEVGGFGTFFATAFADGKFDLISQDLSMSGPSWWIVLFGGVFARLASLTSDQNVVQRYQSTANSREASRALWTDCAVSVPWAVIIFMLGTALYVYFKQFPGAMDPTMDIDQVVPVFISHQVPVGLAGLLVAAIFAASLDGSMLAVATALVNDVYGRLRPGLASAHLVVVTKGLTIVLGAFSTLIAVLLAVTDIRSIWDLAIQMSGLFTGAITGLFILALFFPRVGTRAALVGVMTSAVGMYMIEARGLVHVLAYTGAGVVLTVVAACLASVVWPRGRFPQGESSQSKPLVLPS